MATLSRWAARSSTSYYDQQITRLRVCLGAAWCQSDKLRSQAVQMTAAMLSRPQPDLVAAPTLLCAASLSTLLLVELQFRAPTTCYCLCLCPCAVAKPYSSSSATCHNCICII